MYKISYEHRTARAGVAGPRPGAVKVWLGWRAAAGFSEQAEHESGGMLEQPRPGERIGCEPIGHGPWPDCRNGVGAGAAAGKPGHHGKYRASGAPGLSGCAGPGPGMSRACGLGKNRAGG